jgi:hypothetical protein
LVYGSSIMPTDMGSGGGAAGGSGGGSIRIDVSGVLTLDGEISADGTAGTNTSCGAGAGGGGSGGSILVTAGTLTGGWFIHSEWRSGQQRGLFRDWG